MGPSMVDKGIGIIKTESPPVPVAVTPCVEWEKTAAAAVVVVVVVVVEVVDVDDVELELDVEEDNVVDVELELDAEEDSVVDVVVVEVVVLGAEQYQTEEAFP